jgi:hypothetical protein
VPNPDELVFGDFTPWGEQRGPRRQHVVEAVAMPHQQQTVSFEGITARLYTRRVEAGHSPYTLHVVIAETPQGRQVSSAVKVYDDLQEGVKDLTPLDMLRAFTQHFGYPIRAGGPVDSLVEASMADPSEVMRAIPPAGDFSAQCIMKTGSSPTEPVAVALAWILDTEAYRAYLRAHT